MNYSSPASVLLEDEVDGQGYDIIYRTGKEVKFKDLVDFVRKRASSTY